MKNYEYYIGVDVSKKTLDISVLQNKAMVFCVCISNDNKGLQAFAKECRKYRISLSKALLCLENTGIYGLNLITWAVNKSYHVQVENPIAIKRSLGLVRGKNDEIDAKRIALYAMRFEDQCRLWKPPREVILKLKNLLTMRGRLIISRMRLLTPLKESAGLISKTHQKELETSCQAAVQGVQKNLELIEKKIA